MRISHINDTPVVYEDSKAALISCATLKPCPFCGSQPQFEGGNYQLDNAARVWRQIYSIRCIRCWTVIFQDTDPEKTVAQWERRA